MPLVKFIKRLIIGKAKDPHDRKVFHQMSLVAFFAWIGLGADGLSSSSYGPEETFLALGEHRYLAIFVAILTAVTVLLISASYAQIIELFPTGGGGYLVASKLLSPSLGMVSGCALLIDYVLTIAISIASGADAFFSFLPVEWHSYKLLFALFGVFILMLLNMRGVKESVVPLTPIFLVFVLTHFFAIAYALISHAGQLPQIASGSIVDIQNSSREMGWMGLLFIILRAYSLGAGTYTGIEAVSNGLPILREPKVETGKITMRYMSFSLAFTVAGLIIAYLLFGVEHQSGKTLNAVLFESITRTWQEPWGQIFVWVTLFSEAMILFVAAQAGFLGGPGVLANMAIDRWFPSRFSSLSDRLVTQDGVLLMGTAAFVTVALTHGSVHLLVVLYSINVFITFFLSQAGMVRHWWDVRKEERRWAKKILVSGTGLSLTAFILVSVVILKFHDGGWITLVITALLITLAVFIKRHYRHTFNLLNRLDDLVKVAAVPSVERKKVSVEFDPKVKTAVVLVNGFNGLGLHTVMAVVRYFGKEFRNFIFIQVGVIDAGNFKGIQEIERLKASVSASLDKYIYFMNQNGCFAQGFSSEGTDIVAEIESLARQVSDRYPGAVFFGGQLVFPQDTLMTRWLHNYTVFSIQRRLYQNGIPFMILPIRV
jgi:amino acid transporter